MKIYFTIMIAIFIIFLITEEVPKFYAFGEEAYIPKWTRDIAKLLVMNQINDTDFLQAMHYLSMKGIMKIPEIQEGLKSTEESTGIKDAIKL